MNQNNTNIPIEEMPLTMEDIPIGTMIEIWYWDTESIKSAFLRPWPYIITNHIDEDQFEMFDIEMSRYDTERLSTLNRRKQQDSTSIDSEVYSILHKPE